LLVIYVSESKLSVEDVSPDSGV